MAPWGPPEGLEQLQASNFGSAATVVLLEGVIGRCNRKCDLLDNLRVRCTGFDDLFYFPAPHSLMCEPTRYHVIFLVCSSKDWAPFSYRRERFLLPRALHPLRDS